MPICITGMHRSGTSLVTNLLHLCGVYLGKEDELMPASRDNPSGYWENRKFSTLNDEILAELGGAWDSPPVAQPEWEENERFNPLRVKAEILLQGFRNQEPWGWKDPRNSLTLPFWEDLIKMPFLLGVGSKLKIVLCLRHPLEVFRSLREREYTPSAEGCNLWLIYCQSVLNSSLPSDRIITHYENYFLDPKAELHRVLDFLEIPVSTELIERSISAISIDLRHQRFRGNPRNTAVDRKVFDIYQELCREANFIDSAGTNH